MRTITFSVTASGLPSYLNGAATLASGSGQWVAVASGSPNYKRSEVAPSPTPGASLGFASTSNSDAFSGATVDQTRGELIVCCAGGHDDYYGSETTRVAFRVSNPAWKRLTAPSTDAALQYRFRAAYYTSAQCPLGVPMTSDDNGNGTLALPTSAADVSGEIPLSFHNGMEQQHCNGRVWFTAQSSTARDSYSVPVAFSFDRDAVGEPASPLTHPSNATPWRYHGNWAGSSTGFPGFGVSALDSTNQRVWGFESENYGRVWSIDARTGVAENSRLSVHAVQPSFYPAVWASCAPDLGIVILARGQTLSGPVSDPRLVVFSVGGTNGNTLTRLGEKVVNTTDNLGATVFYEERTGTTNQEGQAVIRTCFQSSYGVVYHRPSKSFLLFEGVRRQSGKIVQLIPPLSGGVYNHAGTWTVRQWTTNYPTVIGSAQTGSNYGRFNIVDDIGNGEPVLVLAPKYDLPTYVCRIGNIS
jgi:hypothetical protein